MTPLSPPLSSPTDLPAPLDADASVRLRAVIGRLSRQLRPTPSGQAAGLSPTRSSLLLFVDRRGPLRIGEVAAAEGLNPTMLSRSITQLVEAGLMERAADTGDRRAAWVSVTEPGHALAERMRAERTAAVNAALRGLPAEQRATVQAAIPALEALAGELTERPI